jgi:hypothetical protein
MIARSVEGFAAILMPPFYPAGHGRLFWGH